MRLPMNKDFLTEEFFIKERDSLYTPVILNKPLFDKAEDVVENRIVEFKNDR